MGKGWKNKLKTNYVVGTESKPTKLESGQVIINKKATKQNLDRLIEINNDGLDKPIKKEVTTDGTDGGLLKGKPHYDKDGKPLGGIPAVVDGARKIETEGEEFLLNKEASQKHWKELSKINQSAGNGVPINPSDLSVDDDPEEFSKGGKINFNPNDLPSSWIYNYAKKIKEKYPKVWDLGGNIFGNEAFKNLERVVKRGYWTENEEWMYIKWRSYVARHKKDFRIAGVIAMLKWVDKVDKGWPYMKELIEKEIDKKYPKKGWKNKMAKGGDVVSYKNKYNKKYGYKENESHDLEEISKDTGISGKGLRQIYNKGVGAYKTNPESVRPNVKSKEQWAMGRVYSAVMGGKAARIDAKELKMEQGGSVQKKYVVFFKSELLNNIIYIEHYSLSLSDAISSVRKLYNWAEIRWIKGFESAKNGDDLVKFFYEAVKNYWSTNKFITVDLVDGKIVFTGYGNSVYFDFMANFSNKNNVKVFKKGYLYNDQTEIELDSEFVFDDKKIYDALTKKMANGGITESQPPVNFENVLWNNLATRYSDGGATSFEKLASASSRFKPYETIVFDPPLIGENGAKLISYTWAYEMTMLPNWEGELVGKRVSDWTQADISAETGRGIVHKYTVELPDGSIRTVSSESVPILLGYVDRSQAKVFGNLATASKTLAKQQMKLAILEAQKKEYDELYAKFEKAQKPEITLAEISDLPLITQKVYQIEVEQGKGVSFTYFKMGDVIYSQDNNYNYNEGKYIQSTRPDNRTIEQLTSMWISERVKEAGGINPRGLYDLKNRVERQKRKVEQMLKTPKMEVGGNVELKKGIKTEQEHKKTLEKIASGEITVNQAIEMTAKDHLKENPKYYTELAKIEKHELGGDLSSYSLKTPTGEKSRLTYLQQVLVRTEKFKEFFGDWETAARSYLLDGQENFENHYKNVSKVLDMVTLEPRVVYHGTRSDSEFFTFDVSMEKGQGRPYAYFAHNKEYSKNFTDFSQRNHSESNPYLYECFLNIRNPFMAVGHQYEFKSRDYDSWIKIITGTIAWDKYQTIEVTEETKKLERAIRLQVEDYMSSLPEEKVQFWKFMARDIKSLFKFFLISYGYDGIFYGEEIASDYDPENERQYTRAVTVFSAKDIKLADGRNLNFNPMETDIRYKDGGSVDKPEIKMSKKDKLGSLLFGEKYEKGGFISDSQLYMSIDKPMEESRLFVDELNKKMKE